MSMLLITNKKEGWCFYSDISIPFSMEILLFSSDLSLFETNRDLEISLAIKNKKNPYIEHKVQDPTHCRTLLNTNINDNIWQRSQSQSIKYNLRREG